MRKTITRFLTHGPAWTALLAFAMTAGAASAPATRTDEANAKKLVKAMSGYVAAQKAFSFDYDTSLEVVTKENQKLALASSGLITVNRPDKIHAMRTGGFANVEYDSMARP